MLPVTLVCIPSCSFSRSFHFYPTISFILSLSLFLQPLLPPTSSLVHPLPGQASLLPRLFILSLNEYQRWIASLSAQSRRARSLLSRNRAIFDELTRPNERSLHTIATHRDPLDRYRCLENRSIPDGTSADFWRSRYDTVTLSSINNGSSPFPGTMMA